MDNKVLVAYHYVAHYRKPIFEQLCTEDLESKYNYFIAADEVANIPSIELIRLDNCPEIARHWISLRNVWITKDILWQKGLLRKICSGKYRSIIFLGNMYFVSTWVACLLCKLLGIRIYMWTHGIRRKETGIRWLFRKAFYMLADGLFLYGERAKTLLGENGLDKQKMHVVYNSLDYNKQNEIFKNLVGDRKYCLRKDLGINQPDKVIVYTGRLTKDKNIDKAISMVAKLNASHDRYWYIIIGDGPELDRLKKLSEEYKLVHRIIFVGSCYDEELLCKYIMTADVMLVTGDIGLTAIHAMSYGTPVITHNQFDKHKPEFEAVVDGLTGSFVDMNDLEMLRQRIEYWAEKKRKDPLATARLCRDKIDRYYNPSYQKKLIETVLVTQI